MKARSAGLSKIALAAAIVVLAVVQAIAAGRHALVIGNSSYRPGYELRNPVADARAMADSLAALGFEVMLLEDTDLATVQRALDAFGPKAITSDAAVIYYAGHGAAIAGRSFLLPVDFSMANFDHVDKEALDTDRLVQTLNSTHSKLKLLMFDACRNNPLESRGAKPLQKADEPPPLPVNTVTIYATAQGMTATDGNGDHSPFAEGVMTNIARPDIEFNALVKRVIKFVLFKTGGHQSVWVDGTVHDDFYLGKYAGPAGSVVVFTAPEPQASEGLVFPNSDTAPLIDADLAGKDAAVLRLARNEILARRGQIFADKTLAEHFQKFAWYQPLTDEPKLGPVEQANLDLIRQYEMKVAAPSQGFIFADSDRRLLTRDEVAPLGRPQLRIARNEIYARRGRKFVIPEVREYFDQFDWYDPRFGEIELTYVEQKNVDLIRGFEK
jgi:caspase domain-containing protein/YARHG domain-containing protein